MADSIPNYPKVTIQLYDDHNGEVRIQGTHHPVVGADAREDCLRIVVQTAQDLGRPVKATAQDPDGSTYPLIVHPDGEIAAVEVVKKKNPLLPVLIAGGAALVLILGTVAYFVFFYHPKPPPPPDPYVPKIAGPARQADFWSSSFGPSAPGFSTNAAWRITLAPDTTPVVSPDGQHVAIVTPDSHMYVLDRTGKVLWGYAQLGDNLPAFATVDGQPVVYEADEKTLRWFTVDGKLPLELDIPDGYQVTPVNGSSPMAVDQTNFAADVVKDGDWAEVNATSVSIHGTFMLAKDSSALIAGDGRFWWAQPGKPLMSHALATPKGATGTPKTIEASPGFLVSLWTATGSSTSDRTISAVHNWTTGAVVAQLPVSESSEQLPDWVPAGSGAYAGFGAYVIDFTAHKIHPVPGFSPVVATNGALYGTTSSSGVLHVSPTGRIIARQNVDNAGRAAAIPWAVVGGRALLVADGNLWAIDAAGGR